MPGPQEKSIEIDLGRVGLILLLAVALALAGLSREARAGPEKAGLPSQDAFAPSAPGRYYLTQATYLAVDADTACTDGYHMATLWEILDTSNLRYDTSLGYQNDFGDGGNGPPTGVVGWVRTGYLSSSGATPGSGNCANWTSSTGSGTVVSLPNDWTTAGSIIAPWKAEVRDCSSSRRVWCARGPFPIYLPLIRR